MNRLLVLVCVVAASAMHAAHAQPGGRDVSDELRAAGQAVLDYVAAIPDPHFTIAGGLNRLLNAPDAQLREGIARDRAELAKVTTALAEQKLPGAKIKGFDLSFALKRMHDEAAANLATAKQGLDALDAMIDARTADDCVKYANHSGILKKANLELRSFSNWYDETAVQTLIAQFAGGPKPQELMQVALAPSPHAIRMRQLADDLAAPLRCPLPKMAFDIEVTIPFLAGASAKDTLLAQVRIASEMDATQRAGIEGRFTNFIVPDTRRFTKWTEAKQPLKFRWDGRVLTPVIE